MPGHADVVASPREHLVTFYETEGFLIDSALAFLAPADASDPPLAIATSEHLAALERDLAARAAAGSDGGPAFRGIEADETLGRITVDGRPDPARFREVVGPLLDDAAADDGRVRVFGEMVALLWERGDVAGAITLEDLWNDLARSRPFALLCAYPATPFERGQDLDAVRAVCRKHSSVVGSESSVRSESRSRLVALLQEEAIARVEERATLRRRRAELEDALERLRELERLRREFVAMVVHDIRSPVAVVSGFLEVLTSRWSELDADDARQILSRASENTERIERLVGDILTMSRIDAGEFRFRCRPVDLAAIVERTVDEIRDATERAIEVRRPSELRPAHADEDRQVQILTNLLSNAVKFSPDGSPVRVTVDERRADLLVSVRDEGVGIAAEDEERLFRPFSRFSGDEGAQRGTGLGLYITRALVEGQGGRIWVESDEGVGSTFSYTVPVDPR